MVDPKNRSRAGLIMTGGGARAAYQVGVLRALAELLPADVRTPFPIICGTSAGA
ncbi:MAG: patatin-like phospholipase family protein, partial [Betaproteobacteria bacterium]|nr:patatin-like phospholipase family protein [Betaproteobacteria bacterium]